jgi:hypothetical protein
LIKFENGIKKMYLEDCSMMVFQPNNAILKQELENELRTIFKTKKKSFMSLCDDYITESKLNKRRHN